MSDWLLREKWLGFYAGSYAPHLSSEVLEPSEHLPWRTKAPASQLLEFLATWEAAEAALRALELGCGTGENLVALAGDRRFSFVSGVDIVPEAVRITQEALQEAGFLHSNAAQVICADVFKLRDGGIPLRDQGWRRRFFKDEDLKTCISNSAIKGFFLIGWYLASMSIK